MLFLALLCVGLMNFYPFGTSHAASDTEYERKLQSALLFARLSEWPLEAFASQDDPFILGVLGENLTAPSIDQLGGRNVSGREVNVVRYAPGDDYTGAHLLFVGDSERARLATILSNLHGLPVMTTSDMEGFAESGGMFELFAREGKVRFKLNQDAAQASGIKIGIKVVKLGEIVHTRIAPAPVAEPIRLAILPALDNANLGKGWERGLYPPFLSDGAFEIRFAADPKLAKALGAQELNIESRERNRLWSGGNRWAHGEPRLDAVRAAVADLDVDGVLMHSTNNDGIGAGGRGSVRVFLLDLNSGELHHADKALTSVGGPDVSKDVTDVAIGLARDELAITPKQRPIRLVMLPGRVPFPTWARGIEKGLLNSLEDSDEFVLTHVTSRKFATSTDVNLLNIQSSKRQDLWRDAAKTYFAGPKIEVVKKVVEGLDTDVVMTYELIQNGARSAVPDVRVYLIDIEKEHVQQINTRFVHSAGFIDVSDQVEDLAVKLLDKYKREGKPDKQMELSSTSTLVHTNLNERESQPIRAVVLPPRIKGIGGGLINDSPIAEQVFLPFTQDSDIKITHSADLAMAKKLGVSPLDDSEKGEIWRRAADEEHAEPDVAVIKRTLNTLDARAAVTFSIPDRLGWPYPLRIYLIDVATDKVYHVDGNLHWSSASHAKQVNELTDKLVRSYLADLKKDQISEPRPPRTKSVKSSKNIQ
jgi:hypothetical protein